MSFVIAMLGGLAISFAVVFVAVGVFFAGVGLWGFNCVAFDLTCAAEHSRFYESFIHGLLYIVYGFAAFGVVYLAAMIVAKVEELSGRASSE